MNRRMNEDLAWLRLQDMQREAENQRLIEGSWSAQAVSALGRLIVRTLAKVTSRGGAPPSGARPTLDTGHHA